MHPLRLTISPRRMCSGMTLVEVVVVIAVQSVLLATAVGLIGRLLHAEQAGRKDLQAMMSLHALAEQFRRDVNAAHEVIPQKAPAGMEVKLPAEHRAAYEIQEGRVQRVEWREGKVQRREAYRLPRNWKVGFEQLSEEPQSMIRMMVSDSTVPRLNCEAVLGLDLKERSRGL